MLPWERRREKEKNCNWDSTFWGVDFQEISFLLNHNNHDKWSKIIICRRQEEGSVPLSLPNIDMVINSKRICF